MSLPRRLWSSPPGAERAAENVELLAAAALGALYCATMSGHFHSIDGMLAFNQARAIAYDRSLRFRHPLWWDGPISTSKYGIGLSLLYVPGLIAWSRVQRYLPVDIRQPADPARPYADPLYTIVGAPLHILITSASAYLVGRFGRELGLDRRAALWGLACYGVASPALVYARGDYAQPLEGLCWLAALAAAARFRDTGRQGALLTCAGAVCYAVLTRLVEGSLLLPAVLVMLAPELRFWRWPGAAWRATGIVAAGFILGILGTLLVNRGRYGSVFATGYEGEGWTTPLHVGLAGALLSPGRGLLLSFPAILFVPLGLHSFWGTRHRAAALALAGLAGSQLLNVAAWHMWWGGWNWGLRLFVPALPLLAVLAARGVQALPSGARPWLPASLLATGLLWALPCVVTDFFGGYAARYDNTTSNFRWRAYPPIGAWASFRRWRALRLDDHQAADILWLRVARASRNTSLLVPVLFGAGALLLGRRIRQLMA